MLDDFIFGLFYCVSPNRYFLSLYLFIFVTVSNQFTEKIFIHRSREVGEKIFSDHKKKWFALNLWANMEHSVDAMDGANISCADLLFTQTFLHNNRAFTWHSWKPANVKLFFGHQGNFIHKLTFLINMIACWLSALTVGCGGEGSSKRRP